MCKCVGQHMHFDISSSNPFTFSGLFCFLFLFLMFYNVRSENSKLEQID